MSTFRASILFLFCLYGTSCTILKKPRGIDHHSHDYPEGQILPAPYLEAVEDCKKNKNPEIRTLKAIKTNNPNLVWKKIKVEGREELRVLAVTWSSNASYFPKPGKSMEEDYEVWVTLVPEVKNMAGLAKKQKMDVDLRLEQFLGLPPNSGHKYFVELWIRPEDLFRPAADPEVNDHEAQYEFSEVRNYLSTSSEYRDWYIDSVKSRYYPEEGSLPYPWTRLGYTYDWNPKANNIGASEYVIIKGSRIITNAVYTTEEYSEAAKK